MMQKRAATNEQGNGIVRIAWGAMANSFVFPGENYFIHVGQSGGFAIKKRNFQLNF